MTLLGLGEIDRAPGVPGKVHAVIGMRRAGKTTFLRQLQADRRESLPPERAVFLSFDDDRLSGLGVDQLALLLEEYYRRFPELRGRETVHWFLDEIQLVTDWERFVRRVMDSEHMVVPCARRCPFVKDTLGRIRVLWEDTCAQPKNAIARVPFSPDLLL